MLRVPHDERNEAVSLRPIQIRADNNPCDFVDELRDIRDGAVRVQRRCIKVMSRQGDVEQPFVSPCDFDRLSGPALYFLMFPLAQQQVAVLKAPLGVEERVLTLHLLLHSLRLAEKGLRLGQAAEHRAGAGLGPRREVAGCHQGLDVGVAALDALVLASVPEEAVLFDLALMPLADRRGLLALERDRVAITITIKEGLVAKIKQINFIGNTAYDDGDILDQFTLSAGGMFTFMTSSDQYSRERLIGDTEVLSNMYLNNGYMEFRIESTQVSISPDKESIYITINMDEGEKYIFGKYKLAGKLAGQDEKIKSLIEIISFSV